MSQVNNKLFKGTPRLIVSRGSNKIQRTKSMTKGQWSYTVWLLVRNKVETCILTNEKIEKH